jgi:hypothetical protein
VGVELARTKTKVVKSQSTSDEPWTDLAENLAGQAVRARAIAAQGEQPVMTWLARLLGVHTEEWAWRRGEKGEELVAKELARLPEGLHVLHSIRLGNSSADIDHLVIGRAGVISLNTKHHGNTSIWPAGNVFMVNGQRQPYNRNSRHEAERVARIPSRTCGTHIDVHGVVVIVNRELVPDQGPVGGRQGPLAVIATSMAARAKLSAERSFSRTDLRPARWSSTWSG